MVSELGWTGTGTLHGWDGCGSELFRLHSKSFFNEDGVMLLMRRTGWARTNIWHGHGWNDLAWFHGGLVRYTSITSCEKVLLISTVLNSQILSTRLNCAMF
jgi:hypothetical protein